MIIFKKKFRYSYGFTVIVWFLLGVAIGSVFILDDLCRMLSCIGALIILSFPILVVTLTSFYVVIDGDVIIIKNLVPFVQRKFYIRDIQRCNMIYNPHFKGYHIAFYSSNKFAVYYPLTMVSCEDIEQIAVLLSGKNILIKKKE